MPTIAPLSGGTRAAAVGLQFQSLKAAVVLVLVALSSIVTAFCITFSSQNATAYDDVGTLMIIIKRFLEGRTLYDQIVVYYGPLYYCYEWCAHVLAGTPVSHDSVQLVSMFFWVVSALLVFLLVYRATNSLLLAVAAHCLSFRALELIGIEPAHPQELCIFLLIGLGLAACGTSSRIVLMVSLGALTAAIVATKINLGVFVVIALVLALLAALRRGWRRSALLATAGAAALSFPVALMWSHHTDLWADKYCFVAIVSLGAGLLAVAWQDFEFATDISDFLFAGSGFAATIVAIGWFAVAHGSSVRGMIDSLILQPQRSFDKSWFMAAHIPDSALPWGVMGLACAGLAVTKRVSESAVALLKLAFAVGVGFFSLAGLYEAAMSFVPPFIWLVAVRPHKTVPDRIGSLPRAILALVATTQILYAYPVAGLQVDFVTVMMIALAAICLSDSLPLLYRLIPRLSAAAQSNLGMLPVSALTILYVFSTGAAIQRYAADVPLGLPGTRLMRIDREKAALERSLAGRIASSRCTMLASAPGLFSFNFLTGKPAPRDVSVGAWMILLSDGDQEKVVAELSHERYPCVLYNQSIIDFWTRGADVSSQPLIRFIKENFEVVSDTSGYQLMEPKRLVRLP